MTYQTLMPWELGVHFERGVLKGVLEPGRHWVPRRDSLFRVDTRPVNHIGSPQEIPAADGVPLRVTLTTRYAVADATAFVSASAAPVDELVLAGNLALRAAVLARPHDEVDRARAEIAAEVLAAVREQAGAVGLRVDAVAVRDVVPPAELRRALLAERVAAAEGRAALERARGETAALRSLLNAARLAEKHPALLQLRALQSAGTVVVDRSRS